MSNRMRHLLMCLRVVVVMFGFNVGLAFAAFVSGDISELFNVLFGTFISLCSWIIVELLIRDEING